MEKYVNGKHGKKYTFFFTNPCTTFRVNARIIKLLSDQNYAYFCQFFNEFIKLDTFFCNFKARQATTKNTHMYETLFRSDFWASRKYVFDRKNKHSISSNRRYVSENL